MNLTRSLLRTPRLLLAMSPLSMPLMAADPASVLPDESIAYLEMDSRAIYKLEEHPVAKALPLKDLMALFYKASGAPAGAQEEIEKLLADEMGMSYDELVAKFGKFALTIHDLKIPENPTPESVGGEISMAGEVDGDEAFMEKYLKASLKVMGKQAEAQGKGNGPDVEELLKKAEEYMEHSTAEHAGAKIHIWKLKDSDETREAPEFIREWAYAVQDKMFVLASGQEQVEEMLDRIKSAGAGSLASSAFYKKDHDKAGNTLGMASLNLEVILGLIEKFALPMAASSEVDVEKIWKALGANKLQSAALALGTTEDALDITALLTYSAKPGLFALPAIPGSGTAPAFLPKGLVSAGYQQIDLLQTIENLQKLAGEVDGRAGAAIQMGLEMAKGQVGVDLKKEILGQLGPDVWTASAAGGEAPAGRAGASELAMLGLAGGKSVIGVRVKDSKAFGLALDSIFNKVAQKDAIFETREYQGFTINNVKESPDEFKIGYVLTDEWLILSVGGGELLEQILGRIGKSGDDGFFAQKNITRHLDALRSGQTSTSVTDIGAAMSGLFKLLNTVMEQSGNSGDLPFSLDELGKLLNVPLLSIDKTWIDESHAEYRARITPKGE